MEFGKFSILASTNNSDGWGSKFVAIVSVVIKEYIDIIYTPLAQLTILKIFVFFGLSLIGLIISFLIWAVCFGNSNSDY